MAGSTPTPLPPARERPPGRWRAAFALGATLLVFGVVVSLVSLDLRARLHRQILDREGAVLFEVARMQQEVVNETASELGLGLEGSEATLEVALHTSKLRGVLAVRVFDGTGAFVDAVPVAVFEGSLAPRQLEVLAGGRPSVRFHRAFALDSLFITGAPGTFAPMLEVETPLAVGDGGAGSIVQYWIDGAPVAAEFSRIDRRVAAQAAVAFGAGGLIIAGAFMWAFRRLASANRLLRRHATELARANLELAQSARTAALGAITAHLMHGLRNPLAGLEDFMAGQSADATEAGGDWASAVESTRRLRALVNEVQSVMSDVALGADFEVTSGEVCAGLRERLQAAAAARGLRLEVSGPEQLVLGAREAGLGGFVLANLVQNAIEASPAGSAIGIAIVAAGPQLDFQVRDHGPGLPSAVAADPFRPRRSTKPDGAGIGLAISRELARHAGGDLALERTGPEGTVFRLRLPTAMASKRGEKA